MNDGPGKSTIALLGISLDAAVPLWIAQLQLQPWAYVQERAKECGQHVAEHGDVIMFKEKGKTGSAFNRLAEGLAALSFCPGGVKFLDRHWESKHNGG